MAFVGLRENPLEDSHHSAYCNLETNSYESINYSVIDYNSNSFKWTRIILTSLFLKYHKKKNSTINISCKYFFSAWLKIVQNNLKQMIPVFSIPATVGGP